MRLQHVHTLQHYLQEMAAESVLSSLTAESRASVKAAAALLPHLLAQLSLRCRGPSHGLQGERLSLPRNGPLIIGGVALLPFRHSTFSGPMTASTSSFYLQLLSGSTTTSSSTSSFTLQLLLWHYDCKHFVELQLPSSGL